jgi:hypothetical protein
MKIEKKYATLIVVILILIFLFAFSYFSKISFKPPVTTGETTEGTSVIGTPEQKTFDFASASCSISGSVDTIKFKIKSTGFNIGQGEMASFLDDTSANFKDSSGNSVDSIALSADSTSAEFSYTTTDHKSSRKITVSSPAGSIDQIVTCS